MPSLTEWILFIGSGLSSGCVFAVVGLGFTLVARVTGVFNFAQGAYVMIGAVIYAGERGSGMAAAPAIVLALAGATAAAAVQTLVMRNDKSGSGGFSSAIATLGYSIVLEGFALWVWGNYALPAPPLAKGTVTIGSAPLPAEELLVVGITVVALVLVGAGLRYTTVGKAMQATAINQPAARLSGISTRRLAITAFVLAGLLGGLLGVGSASVSTVSYSMGLSTGIVGFIAAALGEFRYPVRVVVGGLALGVVESILAGTVSSTYSQVIVYGVLIVWVAGRSLFRIDWLGWLRSRGTRAPAAVVLEAVGAPAGADAHAGQDHRHAAEGPVGAADGGGSPPGTNGSVASVPAPAGATGARNIGAGALRSLVTPGRFLLLVLLAVGILVPLVDTNQVFDQTAVLALLSAIGATGLILLMGLGGQLSLGQGMFYLLGGYAFALLVAVHGWNEWIAILVAIVASSILGLVIGVLCLRLEGINLALVTLAADLAAITIVTNFTSLTGGALGTSGLSDAGPIGPLVAFGVDLGQGKMFYYVILAVTVLVVLGTRNLAKSGIGRALRAVGSDEPAAEGIGIAPIRVKLIAFVVSSALAGLAGALWAYYLLAADPAEWGLTLSISLIVYIIVGGVTSVYGGLIGAGVVSFITYLATSHIASGSPFGSAVNLFVSGGLLILVLRVAPTGIVDGLHRIGDRIASASWRARIQRLGRLAPLAVPGIAGGGQPAMPAVAVAGAVELHVADPSRPAPGPVVPVPAPAGPVGGGPSSASGAVNGAGPEAHRRRTVAPDASPLLRVSGATKTFGGVAALSDVSVDVRPGEILAVIGPNGAGKSTLINVVSGYAQPDAASITVRGRELHRRTPRGLCELGVVRTFQTPRTFGDMTAIDAVTLAIESSRRLGVGRAIVRWPGLVRRERRARMQATEILHGLDVADVGRRIDSLPTGQQRLVDVARALAKRPVCLLLDEPAAGLNDEETANLGRVLGRLADGGLGILLVEHDMDLVTAVADRVVVLDQGRVLTEGDPDDVMREEAVLTAYLGQG